MRPKISIPRKNGAKVRDQVESLIMSSSFLKETGTIRSEIKRVRNLGLDEGEVVADYIVGGAIKLIGKFNLHNGWLPALEKYIVTGKFSSSFDPDATQMEVPDEYVGTYDPEMITISLPRNSTHAEVLHAFSIAKKKGSGRRRAKFRPSPNRAMYMRALELDQRGMSKMDIWKVLQKEFIPYFTKNQGKGLTYQHVNTFIREAKRIKEFKFR